jgi:WD40 repeat protein
MLNSNSIANFILVATVLLPVAQFHSTHRAEAGEAEKPSAALPGATASAESSQEAGGAQLIELARFKTDISDFSEILFNRDSTVLVLRGILSETEVWDLQTKKRLWKKDTDWYAHYVLPDKDILVWLRQDRGKREIVQTDLRTGEEIESVPLAVERGVRLWNLCFTSSTLRPAGKDGPLLPRLDDLLLAGQAEYSDAAQIQVFHARSGKRIDLCGMPEDIHEEQTTIRGMGILPGGKRALITGFNSVILTDVPSGKVITHYDFEVSGVSRLLSAPGGDWAVGCNEDCGSHCHSVLYFFDLSQDKMQQRDEHNWGIAALTLSADGKYVVTGGQSRFSGEDGYWWRSRKSEGGELVVWDRAAMKKLVKLNPSVQEISGVGISADNRFIAAGEYGDVDGGIILYKFVPPRGEQE